MAAEIAIRTQGLGKVYRLYGRPEDRLRELIFRRRSAAQDFWAVRDLDMEVLRGETIGIIGRNGSGKSTLLQMVCGTLQPSVGDLEVYGRVAALLELGAGFNPEFTGRENVYLSATVLGLTETEIAARFPAIEAFAEIGEFIDQPVRHYSSGMYSRLAFAVCAHVDADILVVDEILAVGDAGFQLRCMRFLHAFRQRGTLLFVSHDESAVLALCDRALWLDRGISRAVGPSNEVCHQYRVFLSGKNNDGGAFQLGGKPGAPPVKIPALKPFDFDLDPAWLRKDRQMIEHALLLHSDGQRVDIAEGGAEVILRINIVATRELHEPIVAFVLRNRLGQIIFRDDTAAQDMPMSASIAPGRRFRAAFHFCLPNLPSADYVIEPLLFERGSPEPVDRLLDSVVFHVDSHPDLGGLANAIILHKRLIAGNGLSARVLVEANTKPAARIGDDRWLGRNPMAIQPFNPDAPWHGHGGAKIVDAGFFDENGMRLPQIQGGETVELCVRVVAERDLKRPIVGFMIRNALGQNIFGDNTFIDVADGDRFAAQGETITGHFSFQMPFLPVGRYSIAPAIVDGGQHDRIQLHWIEEATLIHVVESPVDRTIIGVPMIDITLDFDSVADDRSAER